MQELWHEAIEPIKIDPEIHKRLCHSLFILSFKQFFDFFRGDFLLKASFYINKVVLPILISKQLLARMLHSLIVKVPSNDIACHVVNLFTVDLFSFLTCRHY
jgi:hypothetical protein